MGDTFSFSTTAGIIIGETVVLTETGVDTGVFEGSISLDETDVPVAGNGVLEVVSGDLLSAYYDDPADDWGVPVRVKDTALYAATIINGSTIDSDTTWTRANSPYLLTGDVTVDSGITLTIEPGVTVLFIANLDDTSSHDPYDTELIVNGQLHAVGTAAEPILFTSSSHTPVPGDWGGLRLVGNSSSPNTHTIQHAVVEYGTVGIAAHQPMYLSITDSVIQYNFGGINAGNVESGSLLVERCTVADNNGSGIDLYDVQGAVSILNNSITRNSSGLSSYSYYNNGGGNITFSGNTVSENYSGLSLYWYGSDAPLISNNTFTGVNQGGDGIYLSNGSYNVVPQVTGNSISGFYSGISTEGRVKASLISNTISGCRNGIMVRYYDGNGDGSSVISGNIITGNNEYGIILYQYATPTISYNDIHGTYAIRNETGFEVNARNNWWGADVTQEMELGGNPKNLDAFYDYFDESNYGGVNYSGWLDAGLTDSDGDGLQDAMEDHGCTDAANPDTDSDGIKDGLEDANHNGLVDADETDPCDADTDDDGLVDGNTGQ